MADGQGAPGQESGGEFRQKFEQVQAEAAALRGLVADQFGVPADELKGVAPDQIVTRANEIKQAQKAQEDAVLRKALGLGENDDLEAALAKARGGEGGSTTQTVTSTTPAPTPFTSTGSLGGSPPSGNVGPPAFGVDRIALALEGKK